MTKTSATAAVDSSALQRHRSTILDCLKDPDISIRRKALDLSFYLITTQNIRILTRELLSFLEVCETDIKSTVASKICDVAGRYRPNKRWEIDTVVRVLRVAGSWVDQRVVNILVKLTSTGPADIQAYTVCKLFSTIKNGSDKVLSQEGILLASVWCIGEYGHMLKNGVARTEPDEDDTEENSSLPPSEREVVDFLSVMMRGPYASPLVKEYTLTSLVKLTSRFKEPSVVEYF